MHARPCAGTVAFVYFGTLISDIANAASGNADGDPAVRWSVFAVGIAATVAAVVAITVYARRELRKHIGAAVGPGGGGGTTVGGPASVAGSPGVGGAGSQSSLPLLGEHG